MFFLYALSSILARAEPLASILGLLAPCHNTSIPISGDGVMDAFKVVLGIIVMLFGLMGFLLIFVSPVFGDLALPLDLLYFPYAFCLVCELIGVYLLREGLRTDSV
jgi:hypothetical protein